MLLLATAAYAQFTPSDDSYVNAKAATTNYGTSKTLDISSAADTVFIRFDLTAVPSGYTGASIAKATLKLYVNTLTTAGSYNVDMVNGTWTEGTIDYSNAPALGTTIAASVPLAKSNALDYVSIDITPAVVEWLNGTANDGIALVANSPLSATFDSKESTTTSHPPELDIVFAGGSGSGITGIDTASGSGLQGGGTSGTLNLSLLTSCAANQVLQWNGSAWACTSLSGGGTITGVTAGTDLTGGGTSGNVTLNLNTSLVPQLNAANTFTGNQTVNGNVSATGLVTGTAFDIGSNLFAFGSYATGNVSLGFAGNSTMTGTFNTASGSNALYSNTTGGQNTASGNNALYGNTTGTANTATGAAALRSNTTGYGNTASGEAALATATTGNSNTANGQSALYYSTTASNNTADGSGALFFNTTGSSNSGSGSEALYNDTTGYLNTAGGYQALYGNTTGAANTASGSYALQYNTTGGFNTALGYNAGTDQNSPSLTNATAIGANADVTQSNSLVLGSINGVNGAGASTNVGIGTSAPAYTLDVHGTGNFTGLVNFASGQQFPGAGTITGVSAGTALTGGGTSGNVTLNVDTRKVVTGVTAGTDLTGGGAGGTLTLNLDTTKVPQLATANTFTGAQTINNNVTITAANTTLEAFGGTYGVYGAGTAYGVQGSGTSNGVVGFGTGTGVYGSGTGIGVYGTTTATTGTGPYSGVYANASYGGAYAMYAVNSASNGGMGVAGNSINWAVFGFGNIGASGVIAGGQVVKDDRVVSLYAMQSPENWFEDFGSGKLKDGVAAIELDATFVQTVNTGIEYHVFLTPNGDSKGLYVGQKTGTSFEVREQGGGTSNVAFDYRIVAKRRGLESLRLEDQHADRETAEAIRQFIATRPSNTPRLLHPPKPPERAALPEPQK
jgi:hypothetical protein